MRDNRECYFTEAKRHSLVVHQKSVKLKVNHLLKRLPQTSSLLIVTLLHLLKYVLDSFFAQNWAQQLAWQRVESHELIVEYSYKINFSFLERGG